jgi:hypothetical protein
MGQLGPAREPSLALLTAGVAQQHVVGPTGPGRFLFRVSCAAIPDALSEGRHGHLSRRRGAQLGAPVVAIDMPLGVMKPDAEFTVATIGLREFSCRFLS